MALFVAWIFTHHIYPPASADNLTFLAANPHTCFHFHGFLHCFAPQYAGLHLYRNMILPRFSSYDVTCILARSPGMTRIRYILIFPDNVHRISFPFHSSGASSSSFTRNIVFGSACVTVPSTSMISCLLGIFSETHYFITNQSILVIFPFLLLTRVDLSL